MRDCTIRQFNESDTHFYRKCGYQPMLRWLRFEKTLYTL